MGMIVVNALTASRAVLGMVIAWLLVGPGPDRLGFALFLAAIFTDLVDGWLARKLGVASSLGQWLDPLSDKVLTDACWLALWWVSWAPAWLALTLLARDVIVVFGYTAAHRRGYRYGPNLPGRLMVSFEGVALAVLLFHGPWLGVRWPVVGVILGGITLGLALLSAGLYLARGPVAVQGLHR